MMKKESFTQDVLLASHDFETQKDCMDHILNKVRNFRDIPERAAHFYNLSLCQKQLGFILL